MQKMTIIGRIGQDAKEQISAGGKKFVSFTIANNVVGKDGNSTTYWYNVSSYNAVHSNLVKYLTKGKLVCVIGGYTDNLYQSKKTGGCEIGRNIIVDSIDFVNDGSNSDKSNSTTTTNNQTTTTPEVPRVTASAPVQKENITATTNVNADGDDVDDLPF